MNVAIIAAAGQGKRMGSPRAKQFLELAGTPIILHTLRRFEDCADIQETVVVLPALDVEAFVALAGKHSLGKLVRVVPGGAKRSESVWRGLQAVNAATAGVIAVHDGVRPFVTPDEISRTVRAAAEHGAAILTAPETNTIKEVQDGVVVQTLARERLRHALTPQCFRYDVLRRAFDQSHTDGMDATDCSALVERLGEKVAVVDGDPRNIKITRPEDIAFGEMLLTQMQNAELRTQNSELRI